MMHMNPDYAVVCSAIEYLSAARPEEVDFDRFANRHGLSGRQLTDLFRRWCGLSPKSFSQAVALDHAKRLLAEQASVLETSLEVGLSSASRLHDLFVSYQAMPPGVWRDRGAGIEMAWGEAASPFGTALIFETDYGIAGLGFVDDGDTDAAFDDFRGRWPNATFREDPVRAARTAERIFAPDRWDPDQPVRLVMIGTDFEVRVWEKLLSIPFGKAVSYSAIAKSLGKPNASRAVGAAVGRNPISFVVPCHRVVGTGGQLTGYHWGVLRKRAILGWEAGVGAM